MTTITTNDLSAQLAAVFAGVAAGQEFLVTDDGRPVARILPPEAVGPPQEAADAWVARLYAWTDSHPKREIEIDDSREAIYDGCGE